MTTLYNKKCKTPGCRYLRYIDREGKVYEYCFTCWYNGDPKIEGMCRDTMRMRQRQEKSNN